MLTLTRNDVTSQLQPRHSSRRERQPGSRERHSSLKRRLSLDTSLVQCTSPRSVTQQTRASYCTSSASQYIRRPEVSTVKEPDNVISAMKDLSTIEAIRESVKYTEKRQDVSQSEHIPKWMLDLDINLDVTSVDIIPPFEQTSSNYDDVTFTEQPTVTYIYDEDDDIDLYEEYPELFSREDDLGYDQSKKKAVSDRIEKAEITTRSVSMSSPVSFRQRSPSPSGRQSHSRASGVSKTSPRRYQGDKKVLSMQQGGIRSTPMQPTSKKFINQMITFTHVKVHDKKLKKAKPAIDTRMPSSFKIALDRKKLVEERFNGSFDKSYQSSTPRRRPSIKSDTTKQSKGEKAR